MFLVNWFFLHFVSFHRWEWPSIDTQKQNVYYTFESVLFITLYLIVLYSSRGICKGYLPWFSFRLMGQMELPAETAGWTFLERQVYPQLGKVAWTQSGVKRQRHCANTHTSLGAVWMHALGKCQPCSLCYSCLEEMTSGWKTKWKFFLRTWRALHGLCCHSHNYLVPRLRRNHKKNLCCQDPVGREKMYL